jgi:rubrerythrin
MPTFADTFTGLTLGRMLTKEETIRAIRYAISSEYEAAQTYELIAEKVGIPVVAIILNKIADEELVHVGELQELLARISPAEEHLYIKGGKEVTDLLDGENKE